MTYIYNEPILTIPEKDKEEPYPGNIQPGEYSINEVVKLLRDNAENPEAIRFIADMLEE